MSNPPDKSLIPNISSPVVADAQSLLQSAVPYPPLLGAEAVRALALISDSPRSATKTFAENTFDQATKGHRAEVERARDLLQREDARLTAKYDAMLASLNETARNDVEYGTPRAFTAREKRKLLTSRFCLMAVVAGSIATISVIVLDSGIVQSPVQALAFGLVPAVAAFGLADYVAGLQKITELERWKKALPKVAGGLALAWTGLFVTVFGSGATTGIEDIVEGITSGGATPAAPPAAQVLSYAFFIVAILFEMIAGATFKMNIDQLNARVERGAPTRNAFFINREAELQATNAEQSAVRVADAALAGRLMEIDAGRTAYVEHVLTLLLPPAGGSSAGVATGSDHPPRPTSGRGFSTTRNGSIQ